MSEGGEARNHEDEIEAVARVLDHWVLGGEDLNRRAAIDAIAALDAVRRSPQERLREVSDQLRPTAAEMRRRSPQDEDHEAMWRSSDV